MGISGSFLAGLVRPLYLNEYLNDVVRETGVELHSHRLTWHTPLHYENEVYISMHYSQVRPRPIPKAKPPLVLPELSGGMDVEEGVQVREEG